MPEENLKPKDLKLKLLGEKKGLRILFVYKSYMFLLNCGLGAQSEEEKIICHNLSFS